MEKVIPTSWVTNTLLLVLVAVIFYGIFLAVMVGTSQAQSQTPELPALTTKCAQT